MSLLDVLFGKGIKMPERPPLVGPSIAEVLELVDWFQSVPHINISKIFKSYSVSIFEMEPLCKIVVSVNFNETFVGALQEAKIKYDGYLGTKEKLEEAKRVISEA